MPHRHLLASFVVGSLWALHSVSNLAAETRTWTDSSGKFKIEADFQGIVEGQVKLERPNGKKVSLPLTKLCKDDQAYLKELMKRRRSGDAEEENPFEEEMESGDDSGDGASGDDEPGIGGYRVGDRVEVREHGKWAVGKVIGFDYRSEHIQVRLDDSGTIAEAWEGDHWIRRFDARAAERAAEGVAGGGKPVKARKGDWSSVTRVVDLGGGGGAFKPDPASSAGEAPRSRGVTLSKSPGFFAKTLPAAFGPGGETCVAIGTAGGGEIDDPNSIIDICDLRAGRVMQTVAGLRNLLLAAASPSGKRVATVSEIETFQHGPVQVWDVEGKKLNFASAWQASQDDRPQLSWLCWVDEDHLMTLERSALTLWKVDGAEAVYLVGGDLLRPPVFSPGGKQFVMAGMNSLDVHDVKSGDMLLSIPLEGSWPTRSAAFSPSGKLLAVTSLANVTIFDATTGQQVQQIYAPAAGSSDLAVAWVNEGQVLVGGTNLIDVASQMAIWNYEHGAGQVAPGSGGRAWYLFADVHSGQRAMLPLKLPHAGVKPVSESELVLKPGDEMGLELQIDDPMIAAEAEPKLKADLEAAGFKFNPNANAKLVARSGPGESEEMNYQDWGIRRTNHTMNVTKREYELKFVVDGEEVWKRLQVQRPPHFVRLQKDESVQQAVDREMKPTAGLFGVGLPSRVLPLKAAESRTSQITINGLR